MSKNEESRALRLVKWISDKAIDGVRPLSSAHDLAEEYLIDRGYKNHDCRVDALINWETTKNFTADLLPGWEVCWSYHFLFPPRLLHRGSSKLAWLQRSLAYMVITSTQIVSAL